VSISWEWKEGFEKVDRLWPPIQRPREVIENPKVLGNDIIVPFEHPEFGLIRVVANPVKLSQTPAAIRTPVSEFGEHIEEVLLQLGYSWEDIGQFREMGVILSPPPLYRQYPKKCPEPEW
jgi:crotonobetainyl-CoA:carnitine CoA-transferase CaiB-like acyl-CoA transferase